MFLTLSSNNVIVTESRNNPKNIIFISLFISRYKRQKECKYITVHRYNLVWKSELHKCKRFKNSVFKSY